MPKYVVLYFAPAFAAIKMAAARPEDMKKEMESWMVWAKKCGSHLIDMGTPLGNGFKMSKSGATSLGKKGIVGYSLLEAASMSAAKALLKGHPHLVWTDGCEIEVYESMPLPG